MLKILLRSLLAAAVAAAVAHSPAQEQPDQSTPELVTVNGEPVTGLFLHYFSEGKIVGKDEMPAMINRVINSLVLAQQAEKEKLQDYPDVKTLLRAAEVKVLSEAYISKFMSEAEASEEEISKFYLNLKKSVLGEKEHKVAHILVDSEEKAKELIEKIGDDMEKFGKYAREESIDNSSGAQDGDLGWISLKNFVEPFAVVVAKLDEGEITAQPAQSEFGWHVIHLEDVRDIKVPPLDDDMRSKVADAVKQQKLQGKLEELSKSTKVVQSEAAGKLLQDKQEN